ncbi:MAG: phage polymerase-like protein [Caulobacter sp.]|nr:phage polymerase-like protein [Caulobacter sp.]
MTPASDRRAAEALLAFWAEAGVEALYADAAIDRLAEGAERLKARARPAAPPPPPTPIRPARPGVPNVDIGSALAQAQQMAAAANTIEELAEAIAAFEGCPLRYEGARQSVFYRGMVAAPVMVIGEGPGGDEDAQGQPFVGRAGKLLDRMLGAAGLTDRVFITNTVCRCAAAGSNGSRPTARSTCPPCRHCTPPSCCANRQPRRRRGRTF